MKEIQFVFDEEDIDTFCDFAFIENYYPDAVRFKLEVEPENEFAVKAYQKYGYHVSPYFLMTKEK